MGILGFGRANKLQDLKIGDLREEKTRQEVEQDKCLTAMKRAQGEYARRRDMASQPGVSQAERSVAAYRMSQASKRTSRAESDLQRVITRMTVLDSTIEVIRMKGDLRKRGVWKRINDLDEAALENQLDAIAFATKGSDNKLETIVGMLEKDPIDVEFARGPEFDRAMEDIERAAREKMG